MPSGAGAAASAAAAAANHHGHGGHPSQAGGHHGHHGHRPPVNAAAAAAALSSDISRRNPQEDYELLQVQNFFVINDIEIDKKFLLLSSVIKFSLGILNIKVPFECIFIKFSNFGPVFLFESREA